MTEAAETRMLDTTTSRKTRKRRTTLQHSGFGGLREAFPFLVVGFALYLILVIVPVLQTVGLSFTRWKGFGTPSFAGLANYVKMFTTDPVFATALRNSVVWTLLSVVVPNAIALPLAAVLNGPIRFRVAFRAAFYLPSILATVVVAMTWNGVYDPANGLLNDMLTRVGLADLVRPWLGPNTALMSVFAASVWHATGISMVLFLAGLQAVSEEQIDAARIDGANRVQTFWYVELPALRPTMVIVILLSIIGGLKSFDLVFAMTNGGPADSTQVLAAYSWTTALSHHNVGLGSAVATFLFVLTAIFVVPYLRWTFRDWGADQK